MQNGCCTVNGAAAVLFYLDFNFFMQRIMMHINSMPAAAPALSIKTSLTAAFLPDEYVW